MSKKIVSVSCPFPYKGRHYEGFSVKEGVVLGLKPAGCGVSKTQFTFENGIDQPIAFLENASGADFESTRSPRRSILDRLFGRGRYLVIHPVI